MGDSAWTLTERENTRLLLSSLYLVTDHFLPQSRLGLAVLLLVLAALLAVVSLPWALFSVVLAAALSWNALRHSGVWIGFRAFRRNDLPLVRRCLATVRWPRLLSASSRAYYHWLKGVLEAADGRYQAARVHLLLAAVGALRTENDRCLVQCLLAELALQEGDRVIAGEHLRLANNLAHHANVAPLIRSLHQRVEQTAAVR